MARRPANIVTFSHRPGGFVASPFFGFHGHRFGFVAGSPFVAFPHSGFNFFFGFGFGTPFFGTPFFGTPFFGTPFFGAPFFGFPFGGGFTFTGFPFVPGFPFVGSIGHGHFFGPGHFFGHRRFFGFRGFFGFPGFVPSPFGFFGAPFFGFGVPFAPWLSYPCCYANEPGPYGIQDTTGAYLDTLAQAAPTSPGRHEEVGVRPSLGRQLAIAGVTGSAGDSLIVDRVSVRDMRAGNALRLTWRNAGLTSDEVVLFLADSNQAILVAQTLHAPPYTALLEPPAGTAFVGMTVRWPDGTNSTRIVPFKVRQREQ